MVFKSTFGWHAGTARVRAILWLRWFRKYLLALVSLFEAPHSLEGGTALSTLESLTVGSASVEILTADFSKELNFKNAFSVGRNTKISGYLARKFCVLCKRLEFYDSAWIVFTFHRSEGEALNVCLAEVHVTPFALSLSCVLCLVLLENGIEVAVE